MPLTKIDFYRKNYPSLLHIDPYLGTDFYRINVTKPPLDDKRVRRALALTIDLGCVVADVLRGGQLPAFCLTPPGTAGYTSRAQLHEDVAEAKRLLAEAGYPDGEEFPDR